MKVGLETVDSVAIRNEYESAHCNHGEFLGTYQHPTRRDADWEVKLYRVVDTLVFSTNGDPIWEGTAEFEQLLEEYKIDLQHAAAE